MSNQGTNSHLCGESAHSRWNVLSSDTAPHRELPRPIPDLSIQKGPPEPPRHDALHIYSVIRHRNSEGGHYKGARRPQWLFYVPPKFSEMAPPLLYIVMPATRESSQTCPAVDSNPGCQGDRLAF